MRDLDRCEAFHPTAEGLLTQCTNHYNTHVDIGDYLFRLCIECGPQIQDHDNHTVVPVVKNADATH